ncbi:hypothetical protein [Chromobacterium haemolyticum]|uniref:hypothetical protein n=1 Tax=Chromobacterium haemolyticum TaxID=394935 RepID=UPI0024490309|nr:hypothetical protein [Chromobacterium haemolyticum]MDH0341988.1 hypothetical protein [Chromobacterium haemolyticum]
MDDERMMICVRQLTDEHLVVALASLIGEMLDRHHREEMSFDCELNDGTPLLLTMARGAAARALQVEIEQSALGMIGRSLVHH